VSKLAAPRFALARLHQVPAPRVWRERIAGGAALVLELDAGDRLALTDPEGGQQALVFVSSAGALPLPAGGPRADLSLPDASGEARAAIADRLAALSLAAEDFTAAAVLAGEGEPGATWQGQAHGAVVVVIAAPGAPMSPDTQTPATPLTLTIERAAEHANRLPPALATPRLEIRVPAAEARAYRVARGEFIQVIDVDGQQCSDFVAFDAQALANGAVHGIDATTTRTLLGSAFASPGLHAKYFDDRMCPLLEVVRDTVGRHDTFLLACAAKYYEDAGYPGHASCSENFNRELAPHGIGARAGWPAVNLFYNTQVQADGSIGMDEPWSRPGDYVLFRALTDLVCASSACPDDIDPANGWSPTDIHVRVYAADRQFSPGVAHRMTPDSPPQLTRTTGFDARTRALTRHFVEYRGFWLPACYTADGSIAEYWACRERAAMIDLSALRKFEVIGPDAEQLLQLALTRDVRKLATGQVVYSAMCHPHGGMLDDCTLFRFGPANFRLVAGDDYVGPWLREIASVNGLDARVKSSTDQLHNVAVQGPASRDILQGLVITPPHQPALAELGWFRFTIGRLADQAVVVSRTGYSGELGYEIWCHPAAAPAVWDAVIAAGRPHGLAPLGLAALDVLRIEAGLVFAGHDFCDQTDPFEAGIGFTVPAGKAEAYVGSDALARRRDHPQRRLVGLDVHANDAVAHGDPLYAGRAQVGVVTSAAHSPLLARQIALARVDVGYTAPGTALEVGKLDGHQKRLPASVVRFPHYDPDKTRVRA